MVCYQEEEREDTEIVASAPQLSPHPLTLLPGSSDEDPQAILDEHLSRVLKTPGCQSPAVVRHSPRSTSPDQKPLTRAGFGMKALVRTGPSSSSVSSPDQGAIALALGPSRTLVSRQSTKHIHHHYIHHHASHKTKEQIEREAALRVHGLCSSSGECQPCQPYQRSRSLGREMCGAISADSSVGSVPSSSLISCPCSLLVSHFDCLKINIANSLSLSLCLSPSQAFQLSVQASVSLRR